MLDPGVRRRWAVTERRSRFHATNGTGTPVFRPSSREEARMPRARRVRAIRPGRIRERNGGCGPGQAVIHRTATTGAVV